MRNIISTTLDLLRYDNPYYSGYDRNIYAKIVYHVREISQEHKEIIRQTPPEFKTVVRNDAVENRLKNRGCLN